MNVLGQFETVSSARKVRRSDFMCGRLGWKKTVLLFGIKFFHVSDADIFFMNE